LSPCIRFGKLLTERLDFSGNYDLEKSGKIDKQYKIMWSRANMSSSYLYAVKSSRLIKIK
jgi:hypothetical protein